MFRKIVMKRAAKVALVVGTLLALINHADVLVSTGLSTNIMTKIIITYLVPYFVSAFSSAQALQSHNKKHH
jgi:hypothetical protein